eukprot:TRINITY_DN3168_c0_g1_i2.p1 TRINITY_DN3168_c0_g1~~TRINITY_DN3168_c0_g1_i2.p1  ORF type:complete len:1345 (-),score=339.72 TRINITY_DN3168_c0_g1_i2:26-4060(-)
MKRAREEKMTGPQFKRRPEAAGSHQSSEGQLKLTTEDALSYLKKVKDMFHDNREQYDEFLEVMKAFKAQRVDTAGVIARVKDLFKGHRSLILGFNTFLPKGYEITLPEECPPKKQPVDYKQAIDYVNKIKARFQNDEEVYKNFLNILNLYRQGKKTISDVYQEVETLFFNHPDLLEEFTTFLPDASGSARPTGLPTNTKTSPGHTYGANFIRNPHKDNAIKLEKNVSSQNNYHPSTVVKEEKIAVEAENEQWKKFDKEKEPFQSSERKERDRCEKRSAVSRDRDVDAIYHPSSKRKSSRRLDESLPKQTHGGQSGICNGKQSPQGPDRDNKRLSQALFQRVKSKLGETTYQDFLRCVQMYNISVISQEELQCLIVDVFGNSPDLMEDFNDTLSQIQCRVADFESGEEECTKIVKTEKGAEKDGRSGRDLEENGRVNELDRERDRERDKERHFKAKDTSNKPISDLDLSNCESCTPSYRLLPKNYIKSIASFRTELASEVLNDNWVSVTSGSEDYSFKHMRRNQYEESLFSCEDDRFELDMLIECTLSTIKCLSELIRKNDSGLKQEGPINVDKHWTAIHRRCVERIYGDHGFEVIEFIRKDPTAALPVIIKRLKQKCEEWQNYRDSMNKVWADVYAKNYSKSLDHRSFYFKQQDRKSLSTKALLQEIKELHDKRRKEDEILLAIAAGNNRSLIPHLKFDYPDPSIHEDLYKIIKYSSDEVCSNTEMANKVMRVWNVFLEHLLGVPPRPNGAEDTEEMVNAKNSLECIGGPAAVNCSNVSDIKKTIPNERPVDMSSRETTISDVQKIAKEKLPTHGYNVYPTGHCGADERGYADSHPCQYSQNIASSTSDMGDIHKNDTLSKSVLSGRGESSIAHSSFGDASGIGSENLKHPFGSTEFPMYSFHNDLLLEQDNDKSPSKLGRESMVAHLKLNSLSAENKNFDYSQGKWKSEKEEGELSPTMSPSPLILNGDKLLCDSANDVSGKKASILNAEKIRRKSYTIRKEQEHNFRVPDHDIDDGAESAPKSGDDSENAFDGGEEVSGSDSGNEDDCSHDDNEDTDHVEEGKAESEGEAEVADARDTDEVDSFELLERFTHTDKPLPEHLLSIALNKLSEKDTVFYGNDAFYILFRLHQTLYERILCAKTNAMLIEQNGKNSKDVSRSNLYTKFLSALYSLLDGSADNSKFEDECRAIIGTQSYMLFTLDKLIFKLVKQLQIIASDEVANKLLQLQLYERARSSARFNDAVYHANVCTLLHGENIYRFEFLSSPPQLTIQLMDRPEKIDGIPNALEPSFSSYLCNEFLTSHHVAFQQPVFRKRYLDLLDSVVASVSHLLFAKARITVHAIF